MSGTKDIKSMTTKLQTPEQDGRSSVRPDRPYYVPRPSPLGGSGIILGGVAGAALGGPPGAVFGALVGLAVGEAVEWYVPSESRERHETR